LDFGGLYGLLCDSDFVSFRGLEVLDGLVLSFGDYDSF